jgi:hypothetical protein
VYAEHAPTQLDAWPTDPHETIDLNQLVPAVTGRPWPIAHGWYLPLHRPGQRPLADVIRAALHAGYTHLSVDTADLTLAVAKRRHRQPAPHHTRPDPQPYAVNMPGQDHLQAFNAQQGAKEYR